MSDPGPVPLSAESKVLVERLDKEAGNHTALWVLAFAIVIGGVLAIAGSIVAGVRSPDAASNTGVVVAYLVVGATLIVVGAIVGSLNRLLPLRIVAEVAETALRQPSRTNASS